MPNTLSLSRTKCTSNIFYSIKCTISFNRGRSISERGVIAGRSDRGGLLRGSHCPAFGVDRVFVAGMALASFRPLKVKPVLGFLGFLRGTVDKANFARLELIWGTDRDVLNIST